MNEDVHGYDSKELYTWDPEDDSDSDSEELTPKVKYKIIIQEEEFLD
jgi:hypothetical protein